MKRLVTVTKSYHNLSPCKSCGRVFEEGDECVIDSARKGSTRCREHYSDARGTPIL